jgi:prepilin-type processing-associated H-X9-DG protein
MIGTGDGWLVPGPEGKLFANPPLGGELLYGNNSYWEAIQHRRHNGKFNIWFCDGHIEYLPFQNLISRDDARLRRWNNDNQPHKDLLPP